MSLSKINISLVKIVKLENNKYFIKEYDKPPKTLKNQF